MIKFPSEVANEYYDEESIYQHIQQTPDEIPTDVMSREFAVWLTEQYRLAMRKGIELCRRDGNG